MPATAVHALRYPAATDPADVPSDMQKLANDVDVALLPANTVAAAATRVIANLLVSGDANPAFRILGSGRHEWGAGGANATDTTLYRSGANVLATDSEYIIGGGRLYLRSGTVNNTIFFGATDDTYLYRSAASFLTTNGGLAVGVNLLVSGQIYNRNNSGRIYFGTADDTNLYRSAAGALQTDGSLTTGGAVFAQGPTIIGSTGPANQAGIRFGGDTNLYRRGANWLQTDGNLMVGGTDNRTNAVFAVVGGAGNNVIGLGISGEAQYRCAISGVGAISFSSGSAAFDCQFYRNGANVVALYNGAWGTHQAAAFAVQSDRETKQEIESVTDLDPHVRKLLDAGIYTYRRDDSAERHLGLLADELPDGVVLTMLDGDGKTEMQFVDTYKLSAALLAAVQHLDRRLAAVEAA